MMRPIQDLYSMDFEDTGDFGGDALSQNDALANFLLQQSPVVQPQPVPQPVQQIVQQVPVADPVALLLSQAAPATPTVPAGFFNSGSEPSGLNAIIPNIEPRSPGNQFVEEANQLATPTVPEVGPRAPGNQFLEEAGLVPAPTPTPIPAPTPSVAATVQQPKVDYTDALVKQILGSSDTSKWTGQGYGSAEANARDMAKILANAGITDVRQLGVRQEVIPASSGEWGESPEQTVNKYYNKITGQELGNTYSERQTGNFFGGTFTGKGNTGYGVQFDAQGNPYFYTQGASSNDVAQIMQMAGPIGQIAAAYFGGPAAVAAIAAASGKPIGDIIKSAALSYLGGAAGNAVSGIEGITDVLGQTGTDIVSNAAKQFVGSGGKVDPVAALLAGGVNAGVNSLLPSVGLDDLTSAQKNILSSGIMGLVNGQPLDKVLMNAAIGALTSGGNKEPQTVNQQPPNDDEFIKSLEQYKQPTEPTNPQTVAQQPTGIDEFLNQIQPYKQPSIDELLASIEPKTSEQPVASPSNEEILKQIGYEPEPEKRIIPAEPLPMEIDPTIEPIPFNPASILQLPPEPEPEPEPEPVAPSEPEPPRTRSLFESEEPKPADFFEPNPVVEPDTNTTTSEDIIRDLQDAGLTDQEIGLPEPTAPDENVFDPTFGGILPLEEPTLPSVDEDFVPTDEIQPSEEPQYLNTDEDFVPTNQMEEPEPDYLNTDEDFVPTDQMEELEPDYLNTDEDFVPTDEIEEPEPDYLNTDEDFVPTDEIEEPEVDAEDTTDDKEKINAGALKAKNAAKATATKAAAAKTAALAAAKAKADAAAKAQADAIARQNSQLEALLNMMGSNNDVAHIKSYKELFGENLTEPSAPAEVAQSQGEEELFKGGHINDISVDYLLQILRG
jgi:hypothetical protein